MTALLLMFSYVGLAQVVSGTTYSTPSVDNLPTGWSGEDGGGTSYVKLIADSHYIQTAEFEQNGFTSITIKARKFGGPSATQAQITVSWYDSDNSETVLGTIDPSNTTLSNYTINSPATSESGTGYIMIQCKGASSSKGSGVSEVTITYTEPGGTTPTTYTVTYNSNVTGVSPVVDTYAEGADVTLRSANTFTNDGFTFNEWNTQADGDGDPYDAGDVIENIQANIELYAIWEEIPTDEHWVLAELAELTANDVFVIVGNNGSNYAMSNGVSTTTAPSAISVTVTGNEITSAVAASIQWNISGDANDGYTFYPNGDSENWLYCTNTNNGVRVGTNDNKTFVIDATSGYLKHNGTSRYVGIYNSSDWRCYTSYTQANIANQTFAFYKKVTGEVLPPSITANNVNIAYDATSGEIAYTLNNGVEGGALTASTESDWLTLGEVGETVPFTCLANEATVERTATVVLTYTFGDNETVSKDVTVTQAAAPVIYTTIPALFEAATGTETSVLVTFNNWVVSGVSTNGKNVFVTDNNGNGFVIYYNTNMSSTFAAGDILSGTAVSCSLKKYNGFAELLNVDATDLTITSGGTVTVADVAMAELAGINTGALLHYDNLTCVLTTNSAGTTTYYNLTDGTTTIQVYNAIYAFGTLVEGKTYNITGVYQQYNNTKEILPRSADDIEEVVAPSITFDPNVFDFDAEQHVLQIPFTYENIEVTNYQSFTTHYYNAEGEEIQLIQGEAWYYCSVAAIINGEGYQLTGVVTANNGEARSAYMKVSALDAAGNTVYSNLVTVNQAAPVVPPTPGSWVLTSLADLTADDIFVIVGDNGDTYAMSNDNGASAPSAVSIAVVEGSLSGEPADNLKWNLEITNNGYIFYPNGDTENWLYCTNSNNGVKVGTSDANVFSLDAESGYLVHNATSRYIGIYNSQDWRCYTSTTGNIAGQTFAFYKKVEAPVTETHTLTIDGYTDDNVKNGYYLIASPVTVNPADVEGLTEGTFDLYYYDDTQDLEWINYETQNGINADFGNLVPGQGYLYAKKAMTENQTYSFNLTGVPYNGDGEIDLIAGWNLVGNPFGQEAEISMDYYAMNQDGSELTPVTASTNVAAMQGVFVYSAEAGTVMFMPAETGTNTGDDKLVLNVTGNRGNVIDRAIVRFGQGGMLPKFQLHENSTKISIAKDNKDYAVVSSETQGEMPVSFMASENGTYTFSVNVENVEMNYLHLIDNMTGADIDLIANPSYSFVAKTSDYTNRFRLVFNANNGINELSNENFAFFNGSELIVNNQGEATLQVVDILGRVINSQNINGNENISFNVKSGAYMIRLINGNDVKTQKIVVE